MCKKEGKRQGQSKNRTCDENFRDVMFFLRLERKMNYNTYTFSGEHCNTRSDWSQNQIDNLLKHSYAVNSMDIVTNKNNTNEDKTSNVDDLVNGLSNDWLFDIPSNNIECSIEFSPEELQNTTIIEPELNLDDAWGTQEQYDNILNKL
ncbi:uncharacterized protein [Tenebrio molitor]|uniref:uncharacterized protein n=1 Tax=Tenebrio molitor TaxID=7067 RepID=UPI0036248DEE